MGVVFEKKPGKWHAAISIDGKIYHLGYCEDEIEVAKLYYEKAILIGRKPNTTQTTVPDYSEFKTEFFICTPLPPLSIPSTSTVFSSTLDHRKSPAPRQRNGLQVDSPNYGQLGMGILPICHHEGENA
jgi:hypothetical protein